MEYYDVESRKTPLKSIAGIRGVDLETIYKSKKNYYLTYKNTKRVKLDCNNLLIDFSNENDNYVLFMYNNWNIPFYDENECGYFDLEGKKYAINKQYLIYDTFDNYYVLYNRFDNCYYISKYDSNDRIAISDLVDCTEDYVYADKRLYVINNDTIEEIDEKIDYLLNVASDKPNFSYDGSVYDYYILDE